MDLQNLSLPDWLPWWAVVVVVVPLALYLALFLMMPFSTLGLRGRIGALEGRIEELHEEIRGLTLRLPERGMGERGMDPYEGGGRAPPIPPASRDGAPRGGSLGDPVADRMLAYMREKAQSELQRGDAGRPALRPEPRAEARGRAEPRLAPRQGDLPPPPPVDEPELGPEPPPRPPRVPGRFGRLPRDEGGAP